MRERTSSHLISRSLAASLAILLTLVALPASAAGSLIISEYRVRGPNGAPNGQLDEYIEIYNDSGANHTVAAISGTGYAIAASDGIVRCTILNGTVIPARGHFLCVNNSVVGGYSIGSYPAGNGTTATGNATFTADIPDLAGIALFNNNSGGAFFSLANRFDAVGPTTEANTLYKEGTGLPSLTPSSSNINHAWVRDECGKGGFVNDLAPCTISTPKDTDNNAADFYFVDTNGTSAGGGQRLGAPGPQNLSSPTSGPPTIAIAPLDATESEASPPNRVRDFTPDAPNNSTAGTVSIRKRFINNTGANVAKLRFRITDLDTFPAAIGFADLRPRTSGAVVVAGINDVVTCAATGSPASPPCTVTVQGTTLEEPPSQFNGGGFNSSMGVGAVTLGTPLAPGASINLQFLVGIQRTGNFRIGFKIEGLPGAGGFFMVPGPVGGFFSVTPCRVVDTRNPDGEFGGPALVATGTRNFEPRGTCGIPLTALSIAGNVTVITPTNAGNLTIYPTGVALPLTSTINFVTGLNRANNGIFEMGPSGLNVRANMSSGTTHFVLDVVGYFGPNTAATGLVP
jgi:hypothetical protein